MQQHQSLNRNQDEEPKKTEFLQKTLNWGYDQNQQQDGRTGNVKLKSVLKDV